MSEPKNNLPFLSEKQIDEYEKKLLAKMPAFAMGDEAEESRIQLSITTGGRREH